MSGWWNDDKSLHKSGGWRAQYDRVLRWRDRLRAQDRETVYADVSALDNVLAFFQNCFALRDWLQNDLGEDLSELFRTHPNALGLCRDLANGSKHFYLDPKRSPSTRGFAIGRQYKGDFFVVFRDKQGREDLVEILSLADACVTAWQDFLRMRALV